MSKDTFKQYVLSKLDEIHKDKVGKVEPDYVTLAELRNAISKDTKDTLSALFEAGEIKVGDTLNDKFIIKKTWDK